MTGERDIRALFAAARDVEPTDAEVAAVRARLSVRRRRTGAAGRSLALVLVGLVAAATVAAAATGLVPIGQVIGGGFDGTPVRERIVAGGELPGAGPWRMTTFASRRGGADCLKLTLLGPPSPPGPRSAGYCGGTVEFTELALGRRRAAVARGEAILFGTAPGRARSVELRGRDGVVATAPAGGAGPRRYWALAGPAGLADAEIAWRDGEGRIGGRLDVRHRFGRPEGRRAVLRGTAAGGRRWTLTAYEARRLRAGNDVYQPEGLPCLLAQIDPPPARSAAIGGFCGVQPATPGFTRAQRRIGGPRRLLLLYGHAPDAARRVEIEGAAGVRSTAARHAPDGGPGRFWGVALPYAAARGATVRWVGPGGRHGSPVEVLPW